MREMVEALSEAEADATMQRTAARRAATASRRTPTQTQVMPVAPPARRGRKPALIAAGVFGLLLVAVGGWAALRNRGGEPVGAARADVGDLDPHRIAVRYFQSPGDRDSLAYVADGPTEGLIT
jgi:hypothetical protein